MNDNDKDPGMKPSGLKLENENFNNPEPEVEVEVEVDESDITIIDDTPTETGEVNETPGMALEDGPAVMDMAGEDQPEEIPEIEVEAEVIEPEITPEGQPDGSPGAEDFSEAATDDGPPVLDLTQSGDDASDLASETPALDRKIQQLKQGISPEKPKKIGFSTRKFKAGDVIFKEGDPGNEAYLILNGQVKITRQYKGKNMKINQLGKDQIFGEMAIITGEPRAATAKAHEPTEVFIITEQKLNDNLSQNLAIVKNLIDQLIDRMKQLLTQQSSMLSKVERSLLIDKKLEVIKEQVKTYEKKKSPEEIDATIKSLFESILKL